MVFRKKNKLLLRALEAEGRRHPSYEEANGGQSQLEPETFTADTSQRHLPNDTEQIEIRERERYEMNKVTQENLAESLVLCI